MATTYISKAPLTYVRLKGGSAVHVHKGGHVPASADPEDVKRLVKEGFLEEVTLEESGDDDSGDGDSGRPARVRDVLAEVGDDPEKAAAALEVEKAGENRPTLVSKLEEIVAKSADAGGGGGS